MSVNMRKYLMVHGSATMAENDETLNIGGAIDQTVKMTWSQLSAAGVLKVRSESAADTTQTITPYGRNNAGEKINGGVALTGQTPASTTLDYRALMKAVKSASCDGAVGLYESANVAAGTAEGGDVDYLTLDAEDSNADDVERGMVLITTSGTGANQIREILEVETVGANIRVHVRDATAFGSDTVYEVHRGIVFEKTPVEISTVRNIAYDAAAPAAGGSLTKVGDKVFWKNHHTVKAFTNCKITERATGIEAGVTVKNLNAAAAVNKGSGKVGIPVTAHGYSYGETIEINGTVNYDGVYLVDHASTTNEVVITATYVAETFSGAETIRDGRMVFALEDALDDNATNGAGNNREVLPASGFGDFTSLEKTVPNSGSLSPGSAIGVWIAAWLAPGADAVRTFYELEISGQTDAD